jgi:hypothetical protein
VRDRITEWGKRQAVEASTLGSTMLRERFLSVAASTPFLVPGALSKKLQLDRLVRFAKEFDQTPPSLLWSPTVRFEDRAAYEAWAGEMYGAAGGIIITDLYGVTDDVTPPIFSVVPAPPRATYNPMSVVWTLADPGTTVTIEQSIGVDLQDYYRRTLPQALDAKFNGMRPLAQPLYLAQGVPIANFALIVNVKVVEKTCGDCFVDEQNPVLGIVSFYLSASRWLSIFPDYVDVLKRRLESVYCALKRTLA